MGNIFSGSEVVELGIQIEKNGRDFYNTLVKKSKNTKAQEIFRYLAQEEEKHIQAFKNILDKTDKYEPLGLGADEYFAYMNNLSNGYVFTQRDKGEEIAKTTKSDLQAVELGIGFEKDSVTFYEGIKKAVPDYGHKIIEDLIKQEQMHLLRLAELKKIL